MTPASAPAAGARALLAVALLPLAAGAAAGQRPAATPVRRWAIELFGGAAYNFRTPLRIRQAGGPVIAVVARYATRPLRDSPYYMYRVGRWSAAGHRAWELELLHHKIYLRHPPAGVQHFEVTHGYNMLFANRAGRRGPLLVRFGAGVVVAHPEATVRGRVLDGRGGLFGDGYFLAGPAAQLALARRVPLGRAFFATVEGKGTAAAARVPVAGGHATAPNLAAHLVVGLGAAF